MDKYFYWACDYLSLLRLNLRHMIKKGPRKPNAVYKIRYVSLLDVDDFV